jgi:membrane protein DedA with SNARE-associated domain
VVSAIVGDNMGYWIGRRYGQKAIQRYGHSLLGGPVRLESVRRFITRHGPLGVFAARFITGIRFLAGPIAGTMGLRPIPFLVANALGALVYVPVVVAAGYAIGYGLGPYVERLRKVVGEVEHIVLILAIVGAIAALGRRVIRGRRSP